MDRKVQIGVMAAVLLSLGSCLLNPQVVRREHASVKPIQRVIIMPFTDDPLFPGSGLKTAVYLRTALQLQIPAVEWIGPLELLKQQGFDVRHVMDEDPSYEELATLRPFIVKMMAAVGIPPLLEKLLPTDLFDPLMNKRTTVLHPVLEPLSTDSLVTYYKAQAVLRGALSIDLGSNVADRRSHISIAVQLVDVKSGAVLLAFRPRPYKSSEDATLNESLQAVTEDAAGKIRRGWR